MSYLDVWYLTPLERDIIIDEMNKIFDERSGKPSTAGMPDEVKNHIRNQDVKS